MSYGRMLRVWLVALLVLPLIAPISGWSTSLSMGTVRGIRAAELSLDDGKNWLPLGSRSLPVLEGTHLRTSNGGAVVDLSDGSRLNVMPFSLLRFRDASGRTRVSLVHGRMTFLLPRDTRVDISSSTARLESVRSDVMQGEFFVTREGTMGLKMSAGNLEVHELAGSRQVRLASIEPVFLPKRPPGAALLFTSSVAPTSPPSGSKPVFDPRGESLGYLRPDAQLVVQPGYTSNLTRPFPPKLVQFAMAKIDERNREDAVPVFDVNGGYVGYLAGPVFYAEGPQVEQAQAAQTEIAQGIGAGAGASGAGTFLGANATSVLAAGGSVLAVAGGAAGGAVSSASSSASAAPSAATPIEPIRQ